MWAIAWAEKNHVEIKYHTWSKQNQTKKMCINRVRSIEIANESLHQ